MLQQVGLRSLRSSPFAVEATLPLLVPDSVVFADRVVALDRAVWKSSVPDVALDRAAWKSSVPDAELPESVWPARETTELE